MSTKKKLKEEAAHEEAEVTKGAGGIYTVYLIISVLLIGGFILAANSAVFLARNASNPKNISAGFESYQAWPEEIVEQFRRIRVQNSGRVKPANTFARFALIQINNSSEAKFESSDGVQHSIGADEWMLDVLFRSELAKDMPIFNVDDTAALEALGITPKEGFEEHRKRDRYSYNHLLPFREKLAIATQNTAKKQKADENYQLMRLERITQNLGRNISFFEFMTSQFGFARKGDDLAQSQVLPPEMKKMAMNFDPVGFLDVMPEMAPQELFQMISQPASSEQEKAVQLAFRLFFFYANSGRNLALVLPSDDADDQWFGVGDVMMEAMEKKPQREWAKAQLGAIVDLHDAQKAMWPKLSKLDEDDKNGRAALAKPVAEKFGAFVENQRETAKARFVAKLEMIDNDIAAAGESLEGERLQDKRKRLKLEGAKTEREVTFYTAGYFKKSLVYFVISFVILAFSWLAPGTKYAKIMGRIALAILLYALFLNIYGITMRSIIRSRPPITNLYDTVIFITGIVVILGLLLELMTRKGIGLLLAIVSGIGGMFLSMRYEVKEATDTMDPLQAVLDTNFWLATHVTCINIGYAAGMAAAFLGSIYLLWRFLSPLGRVVHGITSNEKISGAEIFEERKEKRDMYKLVSKMTYGIICFGLFFSLVGTVLGGVWANYSWGRFWGWDPKENGALMIVLWSLVILHMRMGGYIRDIGQAVFSVILGIIVTFSWWGVNNLGVGLHSYGFTDGVWPALVVTWAENCLVMACGIPLFLHERMKRKGKALKRARKLEAAVATN